MVNIGNDWDEILKDEFNGENYRLIREFLKKEYFTATCYPSMYDIFNAFRYTPYSEVKAVILGQDPYHGPGQAHGLCFSVKKGVEIPPSLVNIYKELQSDLGIKPPSHGNLESWARQGVMLLNTVLTVRAGQPNSHKNCGWTVFTDEVIRILSARQKPVVFILWGANAKSKAALIDTARHHIISSAHPSPLSAHNGFFGSRPFSRCNACLEKDGVKPIDWRIPD